MLKTIGLKSFVFLAFSFALSQLLFCQQIDGVWYHEKSNCFIEFNGKECNIANSWFTTHDTVWYFNSHAKLNLTQRGDKLKLKTFNYQNGPIFWKRWTRSHYLITKVDSNKLILKSTSRNNELGEWLHSSEELIIRKVEEKFIWIEKDK